MRFWLTWRRLHMMARLVQLFGLPPSSHEHQQDGHCHRGIDRQGHVECQPQHGMPGIDEVSLEISRQVKAGGPPNLPVGFISERNYDVPTPGFTAHAAQGSHGNCRSRHC